MAKPPNRVLGIDKRPDGGFQLRIMVGNKLRVERRKSLRAMETRREYWKQRFASGEDPEDGEGVLDLPPDQAVYWNDQLRHAGMLILKDPQNREYQGAAKTIAALATAAARIHPVEDRQPKSAELRTKTKAELLALAAQLSGGGLVLKNEEDG